MPPTHGWHSRDRELLLPVATRLGLFFICLFTSASTKGIDFHVAAVVGQWRLPPKVSLSSMQLIDRWWGDHAQSGTDDLAFRCCLIKGKC